MARRSSDIIVGLDIGTTKIAAVVGEKYAIREAAAMEAYMREWRQIWRGRSPLVLRPSSTEEVSRILAIANETGKVIAFMAGQTRPLWDFEDIGDWWTRASVEGIAPIVAVPTTTDAKLT